MWGGQYVGHRRIIKGVKSFAVELDWRGMKVQESTCAKPLDGY